MSQARQQLVLIPGSLCDERVWQNQIPGLQDVAGVWVPTLHGHASLASVAEAILNDVPERFALCGFSMGGRVALEMYRLAPQRITRLALVDSSVHPIGEGEGGRRRPQIEMAHREGMAAFADWWFPQIVGPQSQGDAAFMGLLRDMACTFTPDQYETEVRALLERPDPRDLLGRIEVPALVMAGEHDPLSNQARNREMAALIPDARMHIVRQAWHFPMLEKPDEVTAALREWLAA